MHILFILGFYALNELTDKLLTALYVLCFREIRRGWICERNNSTLKLWFSLFFKSNCAERRSVDNLQTQDGIENHRKLQHLFTMIFVWQGCVNWPMVKLLSKGLRQLFVSTQNYLCVCAFSKLVERKLKTETLRHFWADKDFFKNNYLSEKWNHPSTPSQTN